MAVNQRPIMPVPAREVELRHPVPRPSVEDPVQLEAVIDRVGVEIGHVAEQAAARAIEHGRHERGLVHLAAGDDHRRRDVFQDQRGGDPPLHPLDITGDDVNRLAAPGQGGQVADRHATARVYAMCSLHQGGSSRATRSTMASR